jgi:hypothetical protein
MHYGFYDSRLLLYVCPWEQTNLYTFQDSESPIQPHTTGSHVCVRVVYVCVRERKGERRQTYMYYSM